MRNLKYALDYLEEIIGCIKNSNKTFLFLDYDGTLTEIVNEPDKAMPSVKLIELFNSLEINFYIISIVSGRHIKDLKKILKDINTDKVNLIGSHGSEIKIAGKKKIEEINLSFKPETIEIIKKIKDDIAGYTSEIKNIYIEEKPYSFAIHYRNVPERQLEHIKRILNYLEEQNRKYKFKYLDMKKVIEIMPEEQNKGTAIKIITDYYKNIYEESNRKNLILCIGDDITDEDLFNANKHGINIKVQNGGYNDTKAKYYLKNSYDVLKFLEYILPRSS